MATGILNKQIYVNGVLTTTSALRNSLLGRNLTSEDPFELRETAFANFHQTLGQVINIPNTLVTESVWFDEEVSLEIEGEDQRTLTIPLNFHQGDENNYTQYNYVRPQSFYPTLESQYSEFYNTNSAGRKYDTSTNPDRFKLIAQGVDIGRRDPYNVIQTSDIDSVTESFLGIVGFNELNSSIIRSRGVLTEKQLKDVPNKFVDGLTNDSVKSYKITDDTSIDRGIEYTEFLEGSKSPYSPLSNASIGWNEYSKIETSSDVLSALGGQSDTALSTEGRATQMLLNTSDGQKLILYSNLNKNKFIPNYQDPRLVELLGDNTPNSRYYIGDDRSTNRGDTLPKTFRSEQFNDGESDTTLKTTIDQKEFQWKPEGEKFNEKTLLGKTQKIVDQESDRVFVNQTDKYFKDTVKDKYVSKGSALTREDNDPTSFFRVWGRDDEYSYRNALKKNGLQFKSDSPGNGKSFLSVLGDNGIPKTHAVPNDKFGEFKRYMLSIENLAWADNLSDLPACEQGNGDPITGNKGRIMWFAPYDLQFDENVSSNWTATDFIGRGEPVYTYNNTKRSGQLRFKMLVDHPSVINEFRGRQSKRLERFFSGGRSYENILEDLVGQKLFDLSTERLLENELNKTKRQTLNKSGNGTFQFTAYFTSASADNISTITNLGDVNNQIVDLSDRLVNSKELTITLKGYSGKLTGSGSAVAKKDIAKERIETVKDLIIAFTPKIKVGGSGDDGRDIEDKDFKTRNKAGAGATGNEDDETGEKDRRVDVTVKFDISKTNGEKRQRGSGGLSLQQLAKLSRISVDECNYFSVIDDRFPTYFNSISEKIKYFNPGFHSYTPESLNSRMNFLHQCTRQGPSINAKDANIRPQNLSFGRPPVCILRMGDFFNSKIIINSLSLNHAGGGSTIQWDMNPEGIGIQPMMIDVNLSIEIIGGQALMGPINRLQNALSFNFYANTELYDDRSDTIGYKDGNLAVIDARWPETTPPKNSNQTETKSEEKKGEPVVDQKDDFDSINPDKLPSIPTQDEAFELSATNFADALD